MFTIAVTDNYEQASSEAFRIMRAVVEKEHPVLGLATGSSPIGLYKKMIADHNSRGTSYKDCVTFNLDEYIGLPKNHDQSYYTFMHENLFDHLDIPEENIHIPAGDADDEEEECVRYEQLLKQYTLDIQVLGIGSDGHIGFNEPGASFDSVTHITALAEQTIKDNARFFEGKTDRVPAKAITMGLASIMRARKILLIAVGANKADAIFNMIKGPLSTDCPASILQNHEDVTVILDKEAASRLG